jgi:hypothetical protein
MFAALAAISPSEPRGTEMRSLLDDLTPAPSLKELAAASRDFRGCDGSGEHVADFWTADVAGLYQRKSVELSDARANDRTGCHVNDFWTVDVVGLYTLTSAAGVDDPNDPAIKLIELSVASAEAEDP